MPGVRFANPETGETQFYRGGSFGVGEGNFEIVGASVAPHYYGENSDNPQCALKLTLQRLNGDWNKTDDEPGYEMWDGGPLGRFTPGEAADANTVDDAEDLGTDRDKEGNCFYSANSELIGGKASQFLDRIIKLGFKPQVIGSGYLPTLVGTKFTLTKEPNPYAKKAKDPTILLPSKIMQFPWDKAAGSANGGGKGKPAAAGAAGAAPAKGAPPKPAAKPTTAKPSAAPKNDNEEAEAAVLEYLAETAIASVGQTFPRQNIAVKCHMKFTKAGNPELGKAAKALILADETINGICMQVNENLKQVDAGVEIVFDGSDMTFDPVGG